MKRFLIALLLLTGFLQATAEPDRQASMRPTQSPLSFMQNKGQVVDSEGKQRNDVLFTAQNQGVSMYFRANALSYVFPQVETRNGELAITALYRTDVEFVGANPAPQVVSEKITPNRSTFYVGHAPQGIQNVASYQKLTYKNLYDGIDLVFFTTEANGQSQLKYEFIVRPGANPNQIRMRQVAANGVNITREGNLVVSNPLGKIEDLAPYTFQNVNGAQQVVASAYALNNGVVSFKLGNYNNTETLVIDPLTRQWATNVGGSTFDRFLGTYVSPAGMVASVGQSASLNFPTSTGLTRTNAGSQDVVVSMMNANGSLAWSTYMGGSGLDQGFDIDGANGNLTIVGYTTSTNFPVTNNSAYRGSGDGFVFQLNAANGTTNWSTYLGGDRNDQLTGVAVSATTSEIYVTGRTYSNGIATIGQQTIAGSRDVLVANMQSNGSIDWATYVGGTDDDQGLAIAVGTNDDVYVTGLSSSATLATPGVFQTNNNGSNDAFVAKMNNAGAGQWFTYYGGTGTDFANSIDVANGNVFVVGQTNSSNFPTNNGAFRTTPGGQTDAFLFALSGTNGTRVMGTYIGGGATDQAFGVAANGNNVYVVGATNSMGSFPVINANAVNLPFQTDVRGFLDQFIVKFDATAPNMPMWSIVYGDLGDDAARAVDVNSTGWLAVAGYTNSQGFPVLNSLAGQASAGLGNDDGTVVYFRDDAEVNCNNFSISASGNSIECNSSNGTITVTPTGAAGTVQYQLTAPMATPLQNSNVFTGLMANTYTVRAITSNGCQSIATATVAQTGIFIANVSQTTVLCGDGVATLTVTALSGSFGELTYTLNGNMSNTSGVFANVPVGPYTIMVSDGLGCMVNQTGTIAGPAPLMVSVAAQDENCLNNTPGMLTATVMGGTGNYMYSLDNGSFVMDANNDGTFMFMSLMAGSYSVRVRDANGCTSVAIPAVVSSNAPMITVTNSTSPNCFGENTGMVNVSVASGMPNFQYSINGGPFTTTPNRTMMFNGLAGGNQTIQVLDMNGCSALTNVMLNNPTQVVVNVNAVNPTNCTSMNGSVTLSVSGGMMPYTYSFDGGASFSASNSRTGLGNMNFNIVVRDMNGCTINRMATVSSTDAPVIDEVVGINPGCRVNNVSPDGKIIIAASGSNNPLFYSVQSGNPGTYFGSATGSYVFENLPAGTYTIAVANDPFGTCAVMSAPVTITAPPALIVTGVQRVNPTCGTAATGGALAINLQGGKAPYNYSIDGGMSFQTSNVFTGLFPSTAGFTVKIIDDNGCEANGGTYFLFNPSGLTLPTVVGTAPTCGQTNGRITVIPFGGTTPRFYSLNGGMEVSSNSTSYVFLNQPEGVFNVKVRDNSGCIATAQVSLATLNLTLTSTNATCGTAANASTGTISANIVGGTGPYIYTLNGQYYTGLNAAPVTTGLPWSSTAINSQNFTFRAGAVPTFTTGLPAGTYTISVRDLSSTEICLASKVISVQAPVTGFSLNNVTTTNPTCLNANGSVVLAHTGASSSNLINSDLMSTNVIINTTAFTAVAATFNNVVPAGTFTPVLRDVAGCTVTGMPITLTAPDAVAISSVVITQQPDCNGNLGTVTINATGSGTLVYNITGSSTTGWQTSNVFTNVNPGVIPATNILVARFVGAAIPNIQTAVQRACQGTATQSVSLTDPRSGLMLAFVTVNQTCAQPNGQIRATVTGGIAPFDFYLDGVKMNPTPIFVNSYTFMNLSAGSKIVSVTDASGNTCRKGMLATVTQGPIFDFAATPITAVTQPTCNTGAFTVNTVGGVTTAGVRRYSINNGGSYTDVVIPPTASNAAFTGLPAGNYQIVVLDEGGCRISRNYTLAGVTPVVTVNSMSYTNPSCAGLNGTISINVTVAGTAGDVMVRFNGTNATTNGLITAPNTLTATSTLPAGTYSVQLVSAVTAPTACNAIIVLPSISLVAPQPVQVTSVAATQPTCGTAPTWGTISVIATGGSGTFQYAATDVANPTPVAWQSSNVFTNLGTGSYNVQARDLLNFTACASATVAFAGNPVILANPSALDITGATATVLPSCAGIKDGQLAVAFSAFRFPVTLTLSSGETVVRTSAGTFTFMNVAGGSKTITAVDADGCRDIFMTNVLADQTAAVINVTATVNPTTCNVTGGNGTITFNVTGGSTVGREYRLISNGVAQGNFVPTTVGPAVSANVTFANLSSGIYSIEVRATNNTSCVVSRTIILSDPNALTYTNSTVIPANSANCNNGVIQASFNGTGVNLRYEISSDNGLSWGTPQTSRLFLNLRPGTYYVRARTGNGPNFCYGYSTGIVVTCTTTKEGTLSADADNTGLTVYPNPNNGRFSVSYTAAKASNVSLKVVDMTGKTILSTTRDINAGANVLDLDINEAAAGIYSLQLIDGTEIRTVKIAKN